MEQEDGKSPAYGKIRGSNWMRELGPGSLDEHLEALKAEGAEVVRRDNGLVHTDRVNIAVRDVVLVRYPEDGPNGSYFLVYNIEDTDDPAQSNWAFASQFQEKTTRHF